MNLFPFQPDWAKGVKETTSFLTDVLVAYSDAEQRRGLRSNPRRSLAFSIVTMSASETALLAATIFGKQDAPFVVPWWPDAQRLAAPLASGSTAILLDPSTRLFAGNGLAVIWKSPTANEIVSVSSVLSDRITLAAPTVNSWTANETIVLPAFLGRLGTSVDFSRFASGGVLADLKFSGEAGQIAPSGSWTPTQYRGLDVLEVAPNFANAIKRTSSRSLIVLDAKTGDVTVETKSASPIAATSIEWFLADRASIANFRDFLDRRKGRLVPFFAPSWDADLVLARDVLATDSTIRVQANGYSALLFPSVSRRDLAFLAVTGSRVYARVSNAVNNGDGTETLTLSAPIGTAFTASATQVSILELVRLGSDDLDLSWSSSTFSESSLPIVGVPREVPA